MSGLMRFIHDITPDTPICVLVALAKYRGVVGRNRNEMTEKEAREIPFERLKRDLESVPMVTIRDPSEWELQDLRSVSRYANPDERWRKGPLREAYEDIQVSERLKEPPFVTSFGARTCDNPKRCDEVTLYNFCRLANLTFSSETSFGEMVSIYTLFTTPQRYLTLLSLDIDKKLVSEYIFRQKTVVEEDWRKDEIPHNRVPTTVKSSNDAFFASLSREEDLSLADSPIMEYLGIPGPTLKRVKEINKFRTVLGVYFNPNIPIDYYPYRKVISMAEEEGIDSNTEYEVVYFSLVEKSLRQTFYHLLQPEVKEDATFVTNQKITEIDPHAIICFGQMAFTKKDLEATEMTAYTILDLEHAFRSTGEFINPKNGEFFSIENIEKLTRIVTAISIAPKVSDVTKSDAIQLISAIHYVNGKRGELGERVSEWLNSDKEASLPALRALLDASMYMRGWKGPGNDYPVIKAPNDDPNKTDAVVGKSLRKYHILIKDLKPSINDLPLFRHNGKKFIMSTDSFDGITIGERLGKVFLGDTTTQMSTCIRLSSNWLVSSAFYYLQLIGHKPNFCIEDLVDIA